MRISTRTLVATTIATGLLATGVGTAVASPSMHLSIKRSVKASAHTAAQLAYKQAMAKARANFIAAVKPSRDAVSTVGKPAEVARRAKVSAALATYTSVVAIAKAPSLAAEVAYKNALAAFKANPTNLVLKTNVSTALATLTSATLALKSDATVVAARVVFNQARIAAMTEFKATIASAVKARTDAQTQALAQYKLAKQTAIANLKLALKAKVSTHKVSKPENKKPKHNNKSAHKN